MSDLSSARQLTQQWAECEVKNLLNNKEYILTLHRDKQLSHTSYLAVSEKGKSTPLCFFPIMSDTVVKFSSSILLIKFPRYSEASLGMKVLNISAFEQFIAEIRSALTKGRPVKDNFVNQNIRFISENFIHQKLIAEHPLLASTEFFEVSDIRYDDANVSNGFEQRTLWESRILKVNSGYLTKPKIARVSVMTWNVSCMKPMPEVLSEFSRVFLSDGYHSDISFISLQEIDMSVGSSVSGTSKVAKKWSNKIKEAINISPYPLQLAAEYSLGGIYAAFVVSKNFSPQPIVSRFEGIKLGAHGMIANKGAIYLYVFIGAARFIFISCHLVAHLENWDQRNQQLRALIKNVHGMYDFLIIAGDLNYRIELTYTECMELIRTNDIPSLMMRDQFKITQRLDPLFLKLKEPKISFLPTYKFDRYSSNYDTSQKRRTPSYTDRILVKRCDRRLSVGTCDQYSLDVYSQPKLTYPAMPKCVRIERGDSQASDHRSVVASYKFEIPIVDMERLSVLRDALMSVYDRIDEESVPKCDYEPQAIILCPNDTKSMTLINSSLGWVHFHAPENHPGIKFHPSDGVILPGKSLKLSITVDSSYAPKKEELVITIDRGDPLIISVIPGLEKSGSTTWNVSRPSSPVPTKKSQQPFSRDDLAKFGGFDSKENA